MCSRVRKYSFPFRFTMYDRSRSRRMMFADSHVRVSVLHTSTGSPGCNGRRSLTLFGCTAEFGNLVAFNWHPHVVRLLGVVMPKHACLKGLFDGVSCQTGVHRAMGCCYRLGLFC